MRCRVLLSVLVAHALVGPAVATAGSFVRFETTLGDIDLVLEPDVALTVDNFRGYVDRQAYDGSFVHRTATSPSIIQGGGFGFDGEYFEVPSEAPIQNQTRYDNVRGTISMARTSVLNSATSQWFINVGDNTPLQNFAVFGRVASDSMDVVDAIAALPVISGTVTVDAPFSGNFRSLPVLEPLAPFTSECVVFSPPLPPVYDLNQVDNCPDQGSYDAAVEARIAARGPDVPERLVYVERAVALPSTFGAMRIALDAPIRILKARKHDLWEDRANGPIVRRTLPKRSLVRVRNTDAEWFLEFNNETLRALTQDQDRLTGSLEPRGTSGRRAALVLDEESQAALLAAAAAHLEQSLIDQALFLDLFGKERIQDGLGPNSEDEVPPTSSVSLEIVGEPVFKVKLSKSGVAVRLKGRLQFQGTATTVINYSVFGPPTNTFESTVTRPISGELRFKQTGFFGALAEPGV